MIRDYTNNTCIMKASEIKLSYRRKSTGILISNSNDVQKVFRTFWDKSSIDLYESFAVMFLSRRNEVLGIQKISVGGLAACYVDVKKIMQAALLTNSASIILSHNHPSGNLKASNEDIRITLNIKDACQLLNLTLLDHIILTSESYLSMADDGLM